MKRAAPIAALLVGLSWLDAPAAQSLGTVARQEQERRGQSPSGKRYSNDDLQSTPTPEVPPLAPPSPSVASESAEAAKTSVSDSPGAPPVESAGGTAGAKAKEKRDEAYWRTRARDLQGAAWKARDEVSMAEAQLAELEQAGGSPGVAREREVTQGTLDKLRRRLKFLLADAAVFEQDARAQNVPPEWLR